MHQDSVGQTLLSALHISLGRQECLPHRYFGDRQ